MPLRTYKDAVAIVTGGASGIGWGISEELARRGAKVVIADRQGIPSRTSGSRRPEARNRITAAKLDVRKAKAVEKLIKDTVQRHGRLDYLFNNAGIGIGGEIQQYHAQDWEHTLDVNLRGVVNGVKAAYPLMLKQGYGHIVNTASMAGLVPIPNLVAYAASKHAVVGLSKSLRAETGNSGIRVSVLCPGVIKTAILNDAGKYGAMRMKIPRAFMEKAIRRSRPMPADVFARKTLNDVARNKPIIIHPWYWRWIWHLNRLSPSLGLWLAGRIHERGKKEIAESRN